MGPPSRQNEAKRAGETPTGQERTERLAGLAQRAREGDRAAFGELARMMWPELQAMLYHRTHNQDVAEDLAQETLTRAWAGMDGLREPAKVRAWLHGIGLNLARTHHRKRGLNQRLGMESGVEPESVATPGPEGMSPGQEAERRQFWELVGGFTAGLPGREREVFTLRFVDGLTLEEAAEALGINPSTAKTHLYRAVAKMKSRPSLIRALAGEEA